MNFGHPFVHHLAEHFREPEIRPRKHSEYRSHSHNQMKVSDDEVCIVQLNVDGSLAQKQASDAARYVTGTLIDVSGGKLATQVPRKAYELAERW